MKILFSLALFLSLSACSTISYYSQSVQGQMSLLIKRESVDDLLLSAETPTDLKKSLHQAKNIREYASQQLFLPDNNSYHGYVDTKKPYIVWNVFAAPEFSLNPKNWCYPIVGCVSYRGYFSKEDAEKEAEDLRKQQLDVYVGGVSAYSTLGWFDDPLLNTMMHWKQRSLASLIFHELSHQVIYIENETSFNEAFSSAVERLGTIQWLLEFYPEELEAYITYLNAQNDFRSLLLSTRQKLNKLYLSSQSTSQKRQEKQRIIDGMKNEYLTIKQRWPNTIHFDRWFEKPINNARLTSTMTYLQYIPAFFKIFIEEKGDWEKFYIRVIAFEKLSSTKRKVIIENKSEYQINYSEISELIKSTINLNQK